MLYFPRQPGLWDRVNQGLQTVLGLANFVKSWQNQSAMQENRQIENLANRVKLGQTMAELTQGPVSSEGVAGAAEKAGFKFPTVTPERQTVAQNEAIMAGGRTDQPYERIGQEKGRGIAQTVAQNMPVGSPIPFMPKQTKVGVLQRGGGVKLETLPPGVSKIMAEPTPPTTYGIYDQATKSITPTGSMRVTTTKPYVSEEAKNAEWNRRENIRQGNRINTLTTGQQLRETEPDADTGLRVPKSKTTKATGLYNNMKIAAQENGLDLTNEADYNKALQLVQPGKMTDASKQITKLRMKVWDLAKTEPDISLPDGSKTNYAALNPEQQKAWRQQTFDTMMQEIGQSKTTSSAIPYRKGKEWVENGVKYRINPQTGKKQKWVE